LEAEEKNLFWLCGKENFFTYGSKVAKTSLKGASLAYTSEKCFLVSIRIMIIIY